ncbi:MAG: DinB family protein [Gemmatimonadales bacterium]
MLEAIRRMYVHVHWADELALRSLRDASDPPARALELFAHILATEHVWLARMEERRPELPVWPKLTVEECGELATRVRGDFERFVAALGPDDARREVSYVNSAGQSFTSAIEDILLHVALHGCYHRGQVAMLIRDSGQEPQPTDYIALVRGGAAARRTS